VGLLPAEAVGVPEHRRAIAWLKGKTGQESSWSYKLRQRLSGNKDELPEGWPWFPGASAWVIPTSFSILAFERENRMSPDSELSERIASGKRFLQQHMCADGGWNYGGNRALGQDFASYPETTGVALLALRGAKLDRSLSMAQKQLGECRSAEGIAWLRMGLAAHGVNIATEAEPPRRTIADTALWELAAASRNPLI
jgi:hypothetical protein